MTPFESEYAAVFPGRVLEDTEYNRLLGLSDEERSRLPRDLRQRFYATCKWHAEERMSLTSTEGMTVGDETYADVLKRIKGSTPPAE